MAYLVNSSTRRRHIYSTVYWKNHNSKDNMKVIYYRSVKKLLTVKVKLINVLFCGPIQMAVKN